MIEAVVFHPGVEARRCAHGNLDRDPGHRPRRQARHRNRMLRARRSRALPAARASLNRPEARAQTTVPKPQGREGACVSHEQS